MVHVFTNDAAFQKPNCCISVANEAPQDLIKLWAQETSTFHAEA